MGKIKNSEWLDRIDASRKIFDPWHKDYKRWVNFFRGNQWDQDEALSTINPMVINYVFNTIKTMVPTLYYKNPKIYVHPTRPEFINSAAIAQQLVNYDWRRLQIKYEIKKSILRSLIGGMSYIETGYVFETEGSNTLEAKTAEDIERQTSLLETSPEENSDAVGKQEYTEFRIKEDSPFAISRSILEVVIDPFSSDIEERAWHAIREIVPIERVKRDPRFEGTKNLEANCKFDDSVMLNTFREEYQKNSDLKFVELYHITDRWDGKTFTLARGQKNALRKFDTPEGYDLIPVVFNTDPEQPQPISVVEQMVDQQQEKNRLRSYMLEHIKRSLPRMAYDRSLITNEADIEKLANSELGELIGLPGNPAQMVQPLNFPSIPADLFNVDSKLNEDMQIASGLTDFQRGQAIKVPSASEAQFIEQNSRLRVDEGLDIIGDVSAQIAENIIKLRQQFTEKEDVIPITGDSQEIQWMKYDRETLKGEFEFIIEAGSTQKKDQDFMKMQLTQALPIIQQLAQNPDPRMNSLGRYALKIMEFPQPEIDKIFPEQPQQMPQQMPMQGQGMPQEGGAGLPPGIDIGALLQGMGGMQG